MLLQFGYYPHHLDLCVGEIALRTLPGLESKVADIENSESVADGWLYCPSQRRLTMPANTETTLPYSARVFGLPKTHALEHASAQGQDRLQFIIQCFGFFVGMPMSHTDGGFVDATPLRPHATTDFKLTGKGSLDRAILLADEFWLRHANDETIRKAFTGIIHSFFLSTTRNLFSYEQLIYSYVAIEGVHYVHTGGARGPHADRVEKLCRAFGIPLPPWTTGSSKFSIAAIRNRALHEGLFLGEPLGFQTFQGAASTEDERREASHLLRGMRNLICRFVLGLLGIRPPSYFAADVRNRQRIAVRL